MTFSECVEVQASRLGREHGVSAAGWFFDGNTDALVYERTLKGLKDGDPEVLDSLPDSPLSGEWADSFSLVDLARELEVEQDDDSFDDYCTAYEDGYSQAVVRTIEGACLEYLRGAGVEVESL